MFDMKHHFVGLMIILIENIEFATIINHFKIQGLSFKCSCILIPNFSDKY